MMVIIDNAATFLRVHMSPFKQRSESVDSTGILQGPEVLLRPVSLGDLQHCICQYSRDSVVLRFEPMTGEA